MGYFGNESRYNTPMSEADQVSHVDAVLTWVRFNGAEVEEILKEAGYVFD